jgi:hypothetical protein
VLGSCVGNGAFVALCVTFVPKCTVGVVVLGGGICVPAFTLVVCVGTMFTGGCVITGVYLPGCLVHPGKSKSPGNLTIHCPDASLPTTIDPSCSTRLVQ